jgi:hypothetical protein
MGISTDVLPGPEFDEGRLDLLFLISIAPAQPEPLNSQTRCHLVSRFDANYITRYVAIFWQTLAIFKHYAASHGFQLGRPLIERLTQSRDQKGGRSAFTGPRHWLAMSGFATTSRVHASLRPRALA